MSIYRFSTKRNLDVDQGRVYGAPRENLTQYSVVSETAGVNRGDILSVA